MSVDTETVDRESPYGTFKPRVHRILSAVIVLFGVVLLVYMISVEGEPGGIPLLMVALGTGWYVITQARTRSNKSLLTSNN
jgi:hypothetical protein